MVDAEVRDSRRTTRADEGRGWRTALAAVFLGSIGMANALLGLTSVLTDAIELTPAASGGLVVLGLGTTALAVLIWRGWRSALTIGLALFGLLLVAQLGEMASGSDSAEGAGLRLAVLGLLVGSLALARVGDR